MLRAKVVLEEIPQNHTSREFAEMNPCLRHGNRRKINGRYVPSGLMESTDFIARAAAGD